MYAAPEVATPRVLGVDDWALCRGQRYGTMLCDLEHHRRLDLLPDLRRTFADLVDERAGIVEAKVASAQPLSEAQAEALIASLTARTGKTIRLSWHQDQTLLGGVKVQVGSTVLDASLQGQLRQLKTQLLSA